jgi:hypothetical protein
VALEKDGEDQGITSSKGEKEWEDEEEEEVSSHWTILRERVGTATSKKQH